jgi:hypothetical protein
MTTGKGPGFGLALLLCTVALAVILSSCAVVEPPPGGPIDITAPFLAVMEPDSGATDQAGVKTIRLTFSEKMDRTSAATWLYFFPDQRIRKTSWHGATEAEVELEEGLPADTVVVIEVAGGMRDAHKVKNQASRRFPISNGGVIPSGQIRGVLIMGDSAVTSGVIELYDTGPDSLEYFRRPLLRRTVTDENGTFVFDWLPVPGGPWLMRAFVDGDDNLRPGERDPQRLLPDTLSLSDAMPAVAAGVTTLYGVNTPGRLVTEAFPPLGQAGGVMAWTMAITEKDTGWVPAPNKPGTVYSGLDPAEGGTVNEVKPGLNRMVMFGDVDGDSTFSVVPDSLLGLEPAVDDTLWTGWWLEPWILIEGLEVEPGLPARFTVPDTTTTLTPWPEPVAPDTLSAFDDSLGTREEIFEEILGEDDTGEKE